MRKLLLAAALSAVVFNAIGQSAIIRGESSGGVYPNLATSASTGLSSVLRVAPVGVDPCLSADLVKSHITVAMTTATTLELVALTASQVIYVCGFTLSISQVATTANTLKFVRGTGVNCVTGPADLTGAFGTGGITAAAPLLITGGYGGTLFKTGTAEALCATTTIGATAAFHGVLTYVKQAP